MVLSERVEKAQQELREQNLDPGIAHEVVILKAGDVETFESCQGGPGHSYAEPTVRFFGDRNEGWRALAWALAHGLRVAELRRYWAIQEGEPCGPHWEMSFFRPAQTEAATTSG